jgi:benzodiazapine receptor
MPLNISKEEWPELAASVAFCELAGIVPGVLTAEDVSTWYQTLEKPDVNPPDWVFAPVWTTLFFLMGVAFHLVRREDENGSAVSSFLLQLGLNVAWTLVFFRRHSILGGVALIVGLWLAIVATILAFARVNWKAALLLVPYLLWVSFAGYLNVEVWRLNR